ncbi:MAG: MATE family efflux transporter [Lachnospiraceae bacterium]|nr:MATE family efflux transporter [Lachnospiraceae bacterium]
MATVRNMTEGRPGKLIFQFALSLMLGNIFQQMYTFMDTLVVGRCLGVSALAALGATEWLVFLMFGCVQGITQGFSVFISQCFGSGEKNKLKKAIAHSVYLSLLLSVVLTVIGVLGCKPMLQIMGTPKEVLGYAADYLLVLYGAVSVSVFYNLFAAILRGVGDSTTPLKAVTIASVCNIVLDILFVAGFGWGIRGAAIATVLAQMISVGYCLWVLRNEAVLWPGKDAFVPDTAYMQKMLLLGIPLGMQNIITALGGVIVQSVINGFGVIFIAGFTAANKLYGLLETAASSYGYGVASFTGQNKGAGLYDRIKQGFREASILGVATAYVMSAVMFLLGKPIMKCFVTGTADAIAEMLTIGYEFLVILAIFFPLLYLLYIWRACIQGMGNTLIPMTSSMIQLVMRVLCAVLLTKVIGQSGIFWGEILAWLGADALLLLTYYYMMVDKK